MTDYPERSLSDSPRENTDDRVAVLDEPINSTADIPATSAPAAARRFKPRRKRLPLILFLATCLSTFIAGAAGWLPFQYIAMDDGIGLRRAILTHWQDGLIYMVCVLAILLTHEMGHFLATVRYRIPASLPFFLPLPISPIGTMGAVIGMDGRRADRKETFDIGLAGPLAGLIVAIPIIWIGIQQIDWSAPQHGPFRLDLPWAIRLVLTQWVPEASGSTTEIWYSQLNPYFMAGWVGLLITGLNMLPVSQLDGGHVIYTLFGRPARWIARGFMLVVIAYIVYTWAIMWSLMAMLVLLMGTDHPPTRNDSVAIGWFRFAIGLISLLIPLLCFPLRALIPT